MRLLNIKSLLFEGGNIWPAKTSRINKKNVIPTVKFLEKITGLSLSDNLLGTTGLKESSGDIDIAIDENTITKEELIAILKNWAAVHNPTLQIKKSGICVHFLTPIIGDPGKYVQTDFMFVPDAKFSSWAMRGDINSQYRNRIRVILFASLARYAGYKWSTKSGLVNEDGTPVKNGMDPNFVAKILIGPKATAKDISTTESILAALKNDPNKEAKISAARETIAQQDKIELPK